MSSDIIPPSEPFPVLGGDQNSFLRFVDGIRKVRDPGSRRHGSTVPVEFRIMGPQEPRNCSRKR